MKHREYLIIECIKGLPVGKRLNLKTKHKDFIKMLVDAKKYLERKDLRKGEGE